MFKTISSQQFIFAITTISILLLLSYSNSFNCSWHFDDYRNIVNNSNIHLQNLTWEEISKTFKGTGDTGINRPLAYFSFAINYYLGKTNVFGYHVVNFAIHWLSAITLFLFIHRLLQLPKLKEPYSRQAYPIALLSAILWGTSPVHVSSVTYIVQRMTSLAGLFYLLAMLFWLRARTSTNNPIYFYTAALICGVMAFGSKQNAVMLPMAIILLEVLLVNKPEKDKRNLSSILSCLVFFTICLYLLDFSSILTQIGARYEHKPFTLPQRLYTESRIILFYLSLLFYPLSSRLTFLYDFDLSTSLFYPWQTFPAILLILFINIYAVFTARKYPLISFCIIFFFLNHLIESSILPLELIYEHRNYLPSMLLFVPMAILFLKLIDFFKNSQLVRILAYLLLTIVLLGQVQTIRSRNHIFRNEISFWLDNTIKSPNLMRPYQNLSKILLEKGAYEEAFQAINQGLVAKSPNTNTTSNKYFLYHNLANYYLAKEDLQKAWNYYVKSMGTKKLFISANSGLAMILIRRKDFKRAEELSRDALNRDRSNAEIRHTLSVVLLNEQKYDEAYLEAEKVIEINPDFTKAIFTAGEALRMKGDINDALTYYQKFLTKQPNNFDALLAILESSIALNDRPKINLYKRHLIKLAHGKNLDLSLKIDEWGNKIYPIEEKRRQAVREELQK